MSRLGQVALGRLARVVEQALEAQGLRGRHVLGLGKVELFMAKSMGKSTKNEGFDGEIHGKKHVVNRC
jgi:hypothetical protein